MAKESPSRRHVHHRLFRLYDDVYAPGRWELKGPYDSKGQEPEDVWQFTGGHLVKDPGPLFMKFDFPGEPLDYSHGGLDVPVVHARVAEVLTRLAPRDIQLLPVHVEEQTDPYFILVVTRLIRCIDETASQIDYWTSEDGIPEKVGQYSSVQRLHIDRARVGDAQLFRLQDWEVVIVVSEELKRALEALPATGTLFTEVP